MKLFFIFLAILLIFLIPIPIKINIYYSTINYYVKLYGLTIISKKKSAHKKYASIEKEHRFLSNFHKNIKLKSLIRTLNDLKFKPLFKLKFSLDYSLNDAAKTAIFYGVLCEIPPLIYVLINIPFKTYKFNFKINPIFEDKFLLKIEASSIIFSSFANAIYIIFVLFKSIRKNRNLSIVKTKL